MSKITGGEIGFYQDLSHLKALTGRQGLDAAAEGFEAMFLQMVLKSMRNGADALADPDNPLSSAQQDVFRDLYDGQLASILAARGDAGLAEAIGRQLGDKVSSEPAQTPFQTQLKNSAPTVAWNNKEAPGDRLTAFQQPLRMPLQSEES